MPRAVDGSGVPLLRRDRVRAKGGWPPLDHSNLPLFRDWFHADSGRYSREDDRRRHLTDRHAADKYESAKRTAPKDGPPTLAARLLVAILPASSKHSANARPITRPDCPPQARSSRRQTCRSAPLSNMTPHHATPRLRDCKTLRAAGSIPAAASKLFDGRSQLVLWVREVMVSAHGAHRSRRSPRGGCAATRRSRSHPARGRAVR